MIDLRLSEADKIRFFSKLRRDTDTGCLVWFGRILPNGYGQFWLRDRKVYPHRVAWVLAGNEITEERPFVLHNCPHGDNPACCEAAHLWNGTGADNITDMARKRRGRSSSRGLPYGVQPNHSGWLAQAGPRGHRYLGTFRTIEEAAAVAERARIA